MSNERVSYDRMHPPPEKDDLVEIDNLEIAPLSDEELNAVVGGIGGLGGLGGFGGIGPLDSDCTGREATSGYREP